MAQQINGSIQDNYLSTVIHQQLLTDSGVLIILTIPSCGPYLIPLAIQLLLIY